MRTTHLITSLDADGTQRVLVRLLRTLVPQGLAAEVVSLRPAATELATELRDCGVRVRSLEMHRRFPTPAMWKRWMGWLDASRPDVLATWLYHADLAGGVAAWLRPHLPLVWNVRHHRLDQRDRWSTRVVVRGCARIAKRVARQIVCCSHASAAWHTRLGYPADRVTVIPNGYDLHEFKPDVTARAEVRSELGLSWGTPLVGHFGRFHPDKDHRTFVEAAARIAGVRKDVHFVLGGRDVDDHNLQLAAWIAATGLRDRCHLLGARRDVSRLLAAVDLVVSSSRTEAFPNILGEALACGVPCVATDVGDAGRIVGDCGEIVAAGDAGSLAAAAARILGTPHEQLGRFAMRCRKRAESHYKLEIAAQRHLATWVSAARQPASDLPVRRAA